MAAAPSPRHAGRLPWLADAWTSQQRQRLRQLGPGTWPQPLPGALGVSPGWPDNSPVHPAVETAIYPDVIRLAAQTLQAPDTSHRAGR
jgi:hypothetical protein